MKASKSLLILISSFAISLPVFGQKVKSAKTIRLSAESVASVAISLHGTVLSFPVKPTKVILGRAGSFGIEYVENDLAISPLSLNSKSNLYVYLLGRRFTFDLSTTSSGSDSIVLIRDAKENQTKVKSNE